MKPKHRIALIGLGGAAVPHARSLADLRARVEVAAAYTRSEGRAKEFASSFAFPVTNNLDLIEKDRSINCVLIATPPNTHLDLVERFARVGKNILLEKPIETTAARAEAVVEVCSRHNVALGVVLQHRFRSGALRLMTLLQSNELGKVVGANASVPWWRPQSYYNELGRGTLSRDGGGVLITQAIHTLDLFIRLAGNVAEVMAYIDTTSIHNMETEDSAVAVVRLESGGIGTLSATTAAYPGHKESIEIIGQGGTARLQGRFLKVWFHDGRELEVCEPIASEAGSKATSICYEEHYALLAEFFDAVEQHRQPANSGRDALRVHYLIDAILASSRLHAPVEVRKPV